MRDDVTAVYACEVVGLLLQFLSDIYNNLLSYCYETKGSSGIKLFFSEAV